MRRSIRGTVAVATVAMGGVLLAPAAAQAEVGYDNFQTCNNSPYNAWVMFPDRNGATSPIIAPWSCWEFDASTNAGTSDVAVGIEEIDSDSVGNEVVASVEYNPQSSWIQFNLPNGD
jgi:hypothetical protein